MNTAKLLTGIFGVGLSASAASAMPVPTCTGSIIVGNYTGSTLNVLTSTAGLLKSIPNDGTSTVSLTSLSVGPLLTTLTDSTPKVARYIGLSCSDYEIGLDPNISGASGASHGVTYYLATNYVQIDNSTAQR